MTVLYFKEEANLGLIPGHVVIESGLVVVNDLDDFYLIKRGRKTIKIHHSFCPRCYENSCSVMAVDHGIWHILCRQCKREYKRK